MGKTLQFQAEHRGQGVRHGISREEPLWSPEPTAGLRAEHLPPALQLDLPGSGHHTVTAQGRDRAWPMHLASSTPLAPFCVLAG